MVVYIFKSALLLGVLYSCYYILLNKETFHRFNRLTLIGIMLVSLGLPLVKVVTEHPNAANTQLQNLQSRMDSTMDGGMLNGIEITAGESQGMTWGEVLSLIYYIGIAISVLLTLIQIVLLLKHLKGGLCHTDSKGNTVILKSGDIAPYSIFHYIVMSVDDYEHNRQSILTHEQEHIRLHHSLDLVLLEVVKTLQWFNPFVWFLAANLRTVHEYEADEAVINQGIDAKKYQQLLVIKAVGNRLQPFANNLRRGSLKNRIIMMYQKKSNRWMMLKALFVLPVAAFAISAFATPKFVRPIHDVIKKVESQPVAVASDSCNTKVDMITLKPEEGIELNETADDVFFLDGKEITLAEFKKIKEDDIDNMSVCSSEIATRQLGREIKGRAIYMETKVHAQENKKDDEVFLECETNAEFPGGQEALMKFVAQNLKYPEVAAKVGAQGRIIASFVVEKDGSITNIKLEDDDKNIKSKQDEVTANSLKQGDSGNVDEQKAGQQALLEEAARVIKAMPKWNPAIKNGEKVRFKTSLPLTFRLN